MEWHIERKTVKLKLAGFALKWPQNATETQVTQKSRSKPFLLNFFSIFWTVINDRYKLLYLRFVMQLSVIIECSRLPRSLGDPWWNGKVIKRFLEGVLYVHFHIETHYVNNNYFNYISEDNIESCNCAFNLLDVFYHNFIQLEMQHYSTLLNRQERLPQLWLSMYSHTYILIASCFNATYICLHWTYDFSCKM